MLYAGGLFMFPTTGFSKNLSKPVIVVDPGHGGHDHGAKNAEGVLEKNITLMLANLIIENLQIKYQAITTRNGDYFLNISDRTSIANHNKASLLISIHASGSYHYKTNGITISYLKNASDLAAFPQTPTIKNSNNAYRHISWNEIHHHQIQKSMEVGKCIQKRLSQNSLFPRNQLLHSPLSVLAGANMPAVMIEIGYLSNLIEDKNLNNIEYLSNIAKGICTGIDDFYSKVENQISQ